MRVLVVNAGSSSLKLALLDHDDALLSRRDLPAVRGRAAEGALTDALAELPAPDAIGHRVVHGGNRHTAVVMDAAVAAELRELTSLAPLHQPAALAAVGVVARALPGVPAVACFDTAFHATLPAAAATYALPRAWRERWPLRRYGFHGLSHAYVARRAAELAGRPVDALRTISCHLGAGASLCAIDRGRSVETTMGFTPLEGLVMATRAGSMDPGLVLWLIEEGGLAPAAVGHALEHESGLQGLAGTADMREVTARALEGDADAGLALDVYAHRLRGAIGAMAVALGGLDVLAFTGGVGEHAAGLRARVGAGLGLLGVRVDAERNAADPVDADVAAPDAAARTLVIAAREDLEIARQVRSLPL
ncbi:MAG: acetate/propionate family kinase [Solirubrobacteraceae bacterium]